ncbi:hypothetical protein [Planctomyces sp. SH-PL14]|uniref:hypothetical protein n=1 Tax=Planctomyces sp. SH-PL14 TaxID=1632864 RepID=UPI00078DB920|nr:hypothetical protein [Planctomyces sp. SH-PL14]AMV20559.1 hypothetical protein VT03_21855 [Planctomyces sp. SH-PL14]
MSRQRTRWIAVVLGLLVPMSAGKLRAEILPRHPLRHLAGLADAVVLGSAVAGDDLAMTITVTQVLQGPKDLIGHQLRPDPQLYNLGDMYARLFKEPRPPIHVRTALVFLKASNDPKAKETYQIVMSGLRILCENGDVLIPDQTSNPGPYYLHARYPSGEQPPSWEAILKQVQADLPPVERARAAMSIPEPAKRNRAILAWLTEHQHELDQKNLRGSDRKDWGPFQWTLYDRVMESGHPEACWTTLELFTVQGSYGHSHDGPFCSPEGRQLVLRKALDATLPVNIREAALAELHDSQNFWRENNASTNRKALTPEERTQLIEQIAPLLAANDPSLRSRAVHCLETIGRRRNGEDSAQPSARVAELLAARYRVERDNDVRIRCAESILKVADDRFWKDLTGNPHGILVTVYRVSSVQDRLGLWMGLETAGVKLPTAPTFLLERLDANGPAGEVRRIEAIASDPADFFSQGAWTRDRGNLVLAVSLEAVNAGMWRVTAEGTVDEQTWTSVPIEISLP